MSTSTESRALSLLGQGLGPETVSSAVGVSISRISQLLSDPVFAEQVAELRFKNLAKHNERDNKYDSLEDHLLVRMQDLLPLMIRPMEILKAISVINAAKRRGSSSQEAIHGTKTVVQLSLPSNIVNIFTAQNLQLNVNNQVVKVGDKDLITIPAAALPKLLETKNENQSSSPPHSP